MKHNTVDILSVFIQFNKIILITALQKRSISMFTTKLKIGQSLSRKRTPNVKNYYYTEDIKLAALMVKEFIHNISFNNRFKCTNKTNYDQKLS